MRAIIAPNEMSEICSDLRSKGKTVGLVPTMGALHEGHLALMKESLKSNDVTVASIFVNPLQFDKEEDFVNYPSTLESDLAILEGVGVDYVFKPFAEEFYAGQPVVSISFGAMEKVLEGEFRPGHFGGVGVVISRFLHLIQPDHSYFGLKDLQQFLLIKRMVHDLGFPVKVVGVETKRESSGLAMSSRNLRLSSEGKEIAAKIHEGLMLAKQAIVNKKDLILVKQEASSFYKNVDELRLEYLELVDGQTLMPITTYEEISELAVCFAGYVEGVRLIDNLYLRLK